MILSPHEFRLLEGLRLNPRKSFSGRVRGERLTAKKGISIEFSDYREYAEGDDLRHMDWNILARLENAVIKTYRDEEDLAVHLLVDCSASMSFGEPSKWEAAQKIAGALGYIALAGGDALYPRLLGKKEKPSATLRGRVSYHKLDSWLATFQPNGESGLALSLRSFASSGVRQGLVIILSDGLDPEAHQALKALTGRGHELCWIQVLSQIEIDPDLEGDLRLLDAESAGAREITANSIALKQYKINLKAHNEQLMEACIKARGRYALVPAETNLQTFLKQTAKREGWIAA